MKDEQEIEEVDPVEEEVELRTEKLKNLVLTNRSRDNLRMTWEDEFMNTMESKLGVEFPYDILDIMMHHVDKNYLTNDYIEEHPECIMHQMDGIRERELNDVQEERPKEIKKGYIETDKKFDWKNKKYQTVV